MLEILGYFFYIFGKYHSGIISQLYKSEPDKQKDRKSLVQSMLINCRELQR